MIDQNATLPDNIDITNSQYRIEGKQGSTKEKKNDKKRKETKFNRFNSHDGSTTTSSSVKEKLIGQNENDGAISENPTRRMSLRDTRLEDFQVESNRVPLNGDDVIFECEKLLRY